MKKTNSKLINLPKKIKHQNLRNHQGLHFLSMQVIFSLHEKTLAEEIENLSAIIYSATAYQINASCKICEVIYHDDDQIVEFDIAFALPNKMLASRHALTLLAAVLFRPTPNLLIFKTQEVKNSSRKFGVRNTIKNNFLPYGMLTLSLCNPAFQQSTTIATIPCIKNSYIIKT